MDQPESPRKDAAMAIPLTNPTFISAEMFDRVVIDKFQENTADESVRAQAITLMQLLRQSRTRDQILTDVLYAAKKSGNSSREAVAEIGFAMGMQFGYELGLSHPPLQNP
jgi:hypothetical protein